MESLCTSTASYTDDLYLIAKMMEPCASSLAFELESWKNKIRESILGVENGDEYQSQAYCGSQVDGHGEMNYNQMQIFG